MAQLYVHKNSVSNTHVTEAFRKDGQMNLFTIRHRPGTLLCGWEQNKTTRGPVSALALQSDETGFFSGGLDGIVKVIISSRSRTLSAFTDTSHVSNGTSILVARRPVSTYLILPKLSPLRRAHFHPLHYHPRASICSHALGSRH